MKLEGKRIGVAMTGSHCTFGQVMPQFGLLQKAGAILYPILSPAVQTTDTRFGPAVEWVKQVLESAGKEPWLTITDVEPIGPQKLLDLLLIAPCTGNTLAKLANGVVDSSVLMAAKAQLRNNRPVLLFISTNDGLGLNAVNLARLLNVKNIFMVPFGQDNPLEKPNSLVSKPGKILAAAEAALEGRQLQPLLV